MQYDLPDAWVNKIGVRRASVNASLANPFFVAFDKAWDGRDPETANWPARRTVSCSLTLNFLVERIIVRMMKNKIFILGAYHGIVCVGFLWRFF